MPDYLSLYMQFFVPPYFSKKSLLFVCLFIIASTVKVISMHSLINIVSPPGIEPGTLRFQDNPTLPISNTSVATNFIITNLLLYIIYI